MPHIGLSRDTTDGTVGGRAVFRWVNGSDLFLRWLLDKRAVSVSAQNRNEAM